MGVVSRNARFLRQAKAIATGLAYTGLQASRIHITSSRPAFPSTQQNFSSLGRVHTELLAPQAPWRQLYSTSSLSEDSSTWEGANEADDIAARGWQINEESESDWRSHAAAIARSLQLIKGRMRWKEMFFKLKQLDKVMENPDLWQDPDLASKHSRERGAVASRLKSVRQLEVELAEQVGMAELAHEENDLQVAAEATEALGMLREVAKEKEVAALLSGDQDPWSCFLEIQAGAGGTESNDWAAMLMRMYRLWSVNRGFETTIVDEVPGEDAGIKVLEFS
eukprot:c23445_g1_i1 orf=1428-2267(-)